jgi:hypothetical protein
MSETAEDGWTTVGEIGVDTARSRQSASSLLIGRKIAVLCGMSALLLVIQPFRD